MEPETDMDPLPKTDPGTGPGQRILYYVPVHACASGTTSIRTGRLPSGQAIGLGFTTPARLAMVFGASHPWIRLPLGALHAMLEPRGITLVRIDPLPAPAAGAPARAAARRVQGQQGRRPVPGQHPVLTPLLTPVQPVAGTPAREPAGRRLRTERPRASALAPRWRA
jgi:hypothetical protein